MATLIRGSQQVDSAFKKLEKRFEAVQKKINSSAAKKMKSGQYEAATKWMEVGRAFDAFSNKIETIRQEWRDLLGSSKRTVEEVETTGTRHRRPESEKSSRVQRMPKQLDTPALKALMKRGGVASSDEMQGDLHSYVVTTFPDSQLAENVPINFAPWQKTVRRTHRYLVKQGWIERRKDDQWKITERGRSAANG